MIILIGAVLIGIILAIIVGTAERTFTSVIVSFFLGGIMGMLVSVSIGAILGEVAERVITDTQTYELITIDSEYIANNIACYRDANGEMQTIDMNDSNYKLDNSIENPQILIEREEIKSDTIKWLLSAKPKYVYTLIVNPN